MTSPHPEVDEIVALPELKCEPLVLVIATNDITTNITGVLLADLDSESIQRLKQSAGGRERQRKVSARIRADDDSVAYSIPYTEVSHRHTQDIDGCPTDSPTRSAGPKMPM
jgi:hypothetical protein